MNLPFSSLNRMDWVVWVEWVYWLDWVEDGVNIPLLPILPTCIPFKSVAPLLSTPAQILHSGGLVSL